MSLTEIMSGAGLSRYAEAALLLFFFAFLVILWQIFRPSRRPWIAPPACWMMTVRNQPAGDPAADQNEGTAAGSQLRCIQNTTTCRRG